MTLLDSEGECSTVDGKEGSGLETREVETWSDDVEQSETGSSTVGCGEQSTGISTSL